MDTRYVNPFTDFGFKKLFGEEASKPILIDFLNSLLPEYAQIQDLSFRNSERLGANASARKAVYDIYCEGTNGEKFIVELQKAKQDYFIERTIYYSTFPISEQASKGVEWDFNLTAVYCIGILDFTFKDYSYEDRERFQVKHEIKLRYPNGTTFYDKLTYIYLELPNFKKVENELITRQDKWLYFIKHLRDFNSIPHIFQNEVVFLSAFEKAEVANYSREELASYDQSLKAYWDNYNTMASAIRTAEKDGMAKGLAQGITIGKSEGKLEGKLEVAKSLKEDGMSVAVIAKATGLSEDTINSL